VSRKVLPLVGQKSLRAFNAFHTLLLGLKMLPAYAAIDYPTFHAELEKLSEAQKETKLREAIAFVQLSPEEVDTLIGFCTDANGVPYGPINKNNLGPAEMFDCILSVCMEIGRIKIDLISNDEKKN
jgi:hypothetical protein